MGIRVTKDGEIRISDWDILAVRIDGQLMDTNDDSSEGAKLLDKFMRQFNERYSKDVIMHRDNYSGTRSNDVEIREKAQAAAAKDGNAPVLIMAYDNDRVSYRTQGASDYMNEALEAE